MLVGVRGRACRGEGADEGKHFNHEVAIVVHEAREVPEDDDLAAEFFAKLARESGLGGLVGFDFSSGKFPF